MGYTEAPDGWWEDFVAAMPPRTAKLAVVRKDGSPHVVPVWVDLDRDAEGASQIVFLTSAESLKGRAILRDPRISMCFDDERPPFSFLTLSGSVTTSSDPDDLLYWATRIGGRYMGADEAQKYGERNAVGPEMVIRLHPERVIAKVDIAG